MNFTKILPTIGIIVSVVFLLPTSTSAAVIAEQNVKDIILASTGNPRQDFVPGVLKDGELSSITLSMAELGSQYANEFQLYVVCFDDFPLYNTPCTESGNTHPYASSTIESIKGAQQHEVTFHFPSGFVFDSTHAYVFQLIGTETSWGINIYGSRDNVHTGDMARNLQLNNGQLSPYNEVGDLAFIIRTTDPEPTETDLTQSVAEGTMLPSSTITWSATVSDPNSFNVKLEAEIRPVTEAFNETDTTHLFSSDFVFSGTTATLTNTTLQNGHYHVRTRTVTTDGRKGIWHEFGTEGNTDFIIGNEGLTKTFGNAKCFPSTQSWGGNFGMQNSIIKQGEVFSIPDVDILKSITIGFIGSPAGNIFSVGDNSDGVKMTLYKYADMDHVLAESNTILSGDITPISNWTQSTRQTFTFDDIKLIPNERYVFLLERTGARSDDNRYINWVYSSFVPACNFSGDAHYLATVSAPNYLPENYDPLTANDAMGFEINYMTPAPDISALASNVLFLPGIMGSTLYRYDPLTQISTKVWEPGLFGEGTEQVEQLHMNPELNTSNNTDIYAKDILREDWSGSNYYESFASALDNVSGTGKPIKEWEGIGYDWRLAPEDIIASGKKEGDYISYLKATSSPYIIQELRRLAANSKTGKVTIVAHSYGGLVTKALMNTLGAEGANLVDKIIFVAVPQVGTPQAIAGMLYGKNQDLGFGGVAVSEEEAQQLAETLPMGFNLLPSKEYFSTVQEPVLTLPNEDHFASWRDLYGADIQNWDEMHNFLTSTSNRTLLSNLRVTDGAPPLLNHTASMRALATHDTLDAWVPPTGVAVTQIAGWGIPKTVKGVNFTGYDIGDSYCAVDDIVCHSTSDWALIRGFDTTMDGDGTVVTPSALWTSTSTGALNYWVNLDKYNNNPPFSFFRLDKEHGDILEVPELVTFLTDNLTQITKPLTTYKYLSTEVPKYKSPRLRYSLHSPLTLDLYDDQGRHTGVSTTTGQIEEQIPGTYFTQFGEVKYLFTEASTTSHIVMNGYATGTFTFIAEQLQGDTLLASTTWKDIPTTPDTQVTLTTISDISTISPMSIDNNSDGIIDTTLAPRQNDIVTLDITAPEALITFSTSTNAITIQGIDESGTTTLSSTTTYPTLKKNQKQYKGTATTTVTITDQSNNITILTYTEELPSPTKRDVINLTSISYNGAVQNLGTTTLKYKWANNKTTGAYTMFASTFSTSTVVIESHYRPKKNQTLIMNTPIDLDDGDTDDTVDTRPIKTKLQGFVIPSVVTKRGRVNVSY